MIIVVMADTPEEIQKVQHLFSIKEEAEWLTSNQFKVELSKKGYKAGSLITQKAVAEKFGVQMRRVGGRIEFKNEVNKIPNRL